MILVLLGLDILFILTTSQSTITIIMIKRIKIYVNQTIKQQHFFNMGILEVEEYVDMETKFNNDNFLEQTLIREIQNSKLYLEFLNEKIKRYENIKKNLDINKPFFFQKSKIFKYNNKVNDCEEIIFENYKKIENEIEVINKLYNSSKSL